MQWQVNITNIALAQIDRSPYNDIINNEIDRKMYINTKPLFLNIRLIMRTKFA